MNTEVTFQMMLKKNGVDFSRRKSTTIQINLGKLCNQACLHCHVDAGPNRLEIMEKKTVERLLELITSSDTIAMVDLTGGAPELNPHFRFFVEALSKLNIKIIDRCNLTVLLEDGQENTAEFLRDHGVEIYSSLPCYLQENVDGQRGKGVYDKSIIALRKLNKLGYGIHDSGLILNLIYNPGGASLPPDQESLKSDYKQRLHNDWDIQFNDLYTITNMPIKRFRHFLEREDRYASYVELLRDNFNPMAALNVMCKDLVSIDWQGQIYDCDFNQMLEISIGNQKTSIWDIQNFDDLSSYPIACDSHCFGCTAGAGSSCGGQVASPNLEDQNRIDNIVQF